MLIFMRVFNLLFRYFNVSTEVLIITIWHELIFKRVYGSPSGWIWHRLYVAIKKAGAAVDTKVINDGFYSLF